MRFYLLSFFFLLSFLLLQKSIVYAQTDFVKHPDNPILPLGALRKWDAAGTFVSHVIKVDSSGFEMPYVGNNEASIIGADIGYAYAPLRKTRRSEYTIANWREEIDAYWGEGESTEKKLAVFDSIWNKVDNDFNTFQNLDIDWDEIRDKYRPEIEGGVSQGRFVGIINSMARQLQETHLWLYYKPINLAPKLELGQPVMNISSFANNRHFGATLTPLPDSSLLVYKAFPDHPLGLVPGDIILGYEGVPWKKLYKDLLAAELPLKLNGISASTKEACEHIYLSSAGLNWHLYDTIDIVKYDSGDTLHLPTKDLAGQTGRIMGSDQVPVNGIDFWAEEGNDVASMDTTSQFYWTKPDINADYFTYGTLENTDIGYIYLATASENNVSNLKNKLLQAFKELDNDNVKGIIFDLRYNTGGSWSILDDVFSYIYTEGFTLTKMYERSSVDDHFLMKPWIILYGQDAGTNTITVRANTNTSYNKPIALLTGPGCVSAGEYSILKFKKYKYLKIFGKATGGTVTVGNFSISTIPGYSDWIFTQGLANATLPEDTTTFLSHTGLAVDEEIWLDRESVANGMDNVVLRTVEWINNPTGGIDESQEKTIPAEISLYQNYPNPFNPKTLIRYQLPMTSVVNLSLYNILGQKVFTLVSEKQAAGSYSVQWDATGFASGVYLYKLETGNGYSQAKKLVLLK